MTLVLGAPGSGKTTLLRTLAGKLNPGLKFEGKVTYNGESSSSSPDHLCAYVSQNDLHHAKMTVRETIDFSSEMLGSSNEYGMQFATRFGGGNLKTNYILKILGLLHCADIIVGDELQRGISGGQKRRTTIGEMLVGPARCLFMDDASTGLDSSTTLEIMTFLRQITQFMELSMVISLLQPSPEILELFDDIILLCEGQIVYHGPQQNVICFFNSIGFTCPSRKNVADFLQEVTSKMDQKQYWRGDENLYQYHSIEKFVKCFQSYKLPQPLLNNNCNKAETKKDRMSVQQDGNHSISKWKIFKASFLREVLLLKRILPVYVFKAIRIICLAFVIATLFLRTEMNHDTVFDGIKYMGALFLGVVVMNTNSMIELIITTRRLPIFYKQRDLLSLPGWALISPIFLISLPISLMETGLWTCLTYYVIGYAPSFIRFLKQGLYRFIATIGRTPVISVILGTEALVATLVLGGFIISKVDGLRQVERILAIYATHVIYVSDAKTVGEAILKVRGLLSDSQWYWVCIGILFGLALVFNILSIFALEKLKSPYKHQISKESKETRYSKYNQIHGGKASIKASFPFQPLSVVFNQINYFVDMPNEMTKHGTTEKRLQLLQEVSGSFRPGVLTALMGVTGAGKTTLLDVLAGRKTEGYMEGTIKIAGYQKKQETFSRISGYCEQNDIHSPYLTVYESLQFSACLRLPSDVKPHQRDMFIEEVMGLVELSGLRTAMVGIPGATGLSPEQRKRLTIAVELVASPSIIFMDEPTTGLDARAAAIVMRTVRKTVNTGRTVVCTIHQPSIQIFESFDEAIPGVPRIKDGQNPAAWVLEISSQAMEYTIGVDYSEIYRNSSLYRENIALVDELGKPKMSQEDIHFPPRYWPNFKDQCMACLWKQHCSYWKNPELIIVRFVNTFAISVIFGTVFWKVGSSIKVVQDVFNVVGVAYGAALFLGFMNCNSLQPIVVMERVVLYREKASGMYSSMAFVIAQIAIEIPYMLIQTAIFSAIVYPMVGFQFSTAKFFLFVLYMMLTFMDYTLFGMMAVALTPNAEVASLLSFSIFMIWNIFSGFFIPRKAMPTWWRWMYWADPAAWSLYGLVFSQLGDRTELISMLGQPDQPVSQFLEDYLGLQKDSIPLVTTLHIAISVLFILAFCIGIKYLNFQRRVF
uniref:ABC transporter domain-containing protein n=1 Tax=Leersia perrieri TaxID=77586 RepID=A0A0D9XC12_9ORYZ